jgi:hypothetical protein
MKMLLVFVLEALRPISDRAVAGYRSRRAELKLLRAEKP